MTDVLDGFSQKARDHTRVPMQVRLVRCQSILVNKSSSGTLHLTQDLQQDIHGCASTKIIKRGMSPLKWMILLVFYRSIEAPLNSERII